MSNRHHEKFIASITGGIILITGGILLITFIATNQTRKEDWFIWAIGIAILIVVGLLLFGSAYVHKVKSDLIRKQKHKDEHKKPLEES